MSVDNVRIYFESSKIVSFYLKRSEGGRWPTERSVFKFFLKCWLILLSINRLKLHNIILASKFKWKNFKNSNFVLCETYERRETFTQYFRTHAACAIDDGFWQILFFAAKLRPCAFIYQQPSKLLSDVNSYDDMIGKVEKSRPSLHAHTPFFGMIPKLELLLLPTSSWLLSSVNWILCFSQTANGAQDFDAVWLGTSSH